MQRAAALPRGRKLGSAVTFAPPQRTRRTAGARHALRICLPTRPRRETLSRRPRPTGRSHWLRRRRRRLNAAGSVLGPCAQPVCSVHGQSGPRAEREQPMGGRPSTQGRPFLPSPLPFPLDRKDCAGGATVGIGARRACVPRTGPSSRSGDGRVRGGQFFAVTFLQVLAEPPGAALVTGRGLSCARLDVTARGPSQLPHLALAEGASAAGQAVGVSTSGVPAPPTCPFSSS